MAAWFLNARFRLRRMTGVDRYAHELAACAAARLGLSEIVPAQARWASGPAGQLWDQTALLRASHAGRLWSPCGTGPLLHPRHVVTIHDVGPIDMPEGYAPAFAALYQVLYPALARNARLVLTVSEDARARVIRACGVAAERVAVVPNGVGGAFRADPDPRDAAALESHGLRSGGYVLALGSLSPRKNLARLLSAWDRLGKARSGLELALAGGVIPRIFGTSGLPPQADVRWLGYVPDERLPALYRHARAFVFPSLYEGFGIPAIEAMACGCPVLYAAATSLPEVCGGAGLAFDPLDPEAIATVLADFLADPTAAVRLRPLGLARAAGYTWTAAADRLVAALDGI